VEIILPENCPEKYIKAYIFFIFQWIECKFENEQNRRIERPKNDGKKKWTYEGFENVKYISIYLTSI
jgi:hypothetical protein